MHISAEVWGIILSVVGIALSIYFGMKGVAFLRSKRVTQHQKTGDNSVSIQSGRDTKIGQ